MPDCKDIFDDNKSSLINNRHNFKPFIRSLIYFMCPKFIRLALELALTVTLPLQVCEQLIDKHLVSYKHTTLNTLHIFAATMLRIAHF